MIYVTYSQNIQKKILHIGVCLYVCAQMHIQKRTYTEKAQIISEMR